MTTKKNYKEITGENDKKEKVTLVIKRPSARDNLEAKKVHLRSFRVAIESGAYVEEEVEKILKDRGIWNDEKEKQFDELNKKIVAGEKQLARGGKDEKGKTRTF